MTHRFTLDVYYEDTDMGGIVYHPNYFKFCERARSHWVRTLGIDQNALRESGTIFAARKIDAEFLAPARFEDHLEVRSDLVKTSGVRCILVQEVARDETVLFRARVEIVALRMDGGVARLPAALRTAIT